MRLEVFSCEVESNYPLLILNWTEVYGEEMIFFSSPTSDHVARMIILEDAIIVEHDIGIAQSGTFDKDNRSLAIRFIECLFALFSSDKEYLRKSYQEGVDAFFSGNNISPYQNDDCHVMWLKGFEDAQDRYKT